MVTEGLNRKKLAGFRFGDTRRMAILNQGSVTRRGDRNNNPYPDSESPGDI